MTDRNRKVKNEYLFAEKLSIGENIHPDCLLDLTADFGAKLDLLVCQ